MAEKRYKFSDEESKRIKDKLSSLEQALGLFFQEHQLKTYESLVDEAMINGVERTIERFNKYLDSCYKDKPSIWDN